MTTNVQYDLTATNLAPGSAPQSVLLTAVVNPDGSAISAGASGGSSGATSFASEFVTSDTPVDIKVPAGAMSVLKSLRATAYDPQAAQAGTGVLHLIIDSVVYSLPYAAASASTNNVFELAYLENLNMPITGNAIQAQLGSALTGGGIVVTATFA